MKFHTTSKLIKKILLVPFIFVNILAGNQTHAAIALDRTRVIFDGNEKSVSLNIANKNKQLPYLAQGWIEDEHGQKIQSPFTVLPPVQRLDPGKPSQIKIQALPTVQSLPQDRETLYYFNLREIPPKSNKANTLQIALQTRIKMFYRPASIAVQDDSTPVQEKLTMKISDNDFIVNNPTPYYISLIGVSNNKNTTSVKNFSPLMLPPKGSMPLKVNAEAIGQHPVLTYINDYGGRPQLNFNCNGSTCTTTPDKKGRN